MSLADYLKRCIPEFQQTDSPLTSYLDVSGEFLSEMKEAIEQFDKHRDWRKGSELSVDMTTKQRGFTLPSNMSYEAKRIFLRDIAEVIKRNGTEDGLIHALKMVGYNAEVRPAWIPCAERLDEGYLVDVVTGQEKYYELDRESYRDFLYGDEVITENGVYFSGFRYVDDVFQQNKIDNVPISGEIYEEYQPHNISVTKSPYSVIRLNDGEFNVDVAEYTNPITGKTYKYSNDEEFQLVNDIVDFFIKSGYRATTIRAIIIAFLQQFEDEINVSENYIELTTYTPDGGDNLSDSVPICENGINASRVFVDGSIGSNMCVGAEIPYESPISIIKPLPIGLDSDYINERYRWGSFSNTYELRLDKVYPDFLLRYGTRVSLINTSEVDIDVYINGELTQTIEVGFEFGLLTNYTQHTISFVPKTFLDSHVFFKLSGDSFVQDEERETENCGGGFLIELERVVDDSLTISEKFEEIFPLNIDEFDDSYQISENTDKQGIVFVSGQIGSNMITGSEIPFESPLSIIRPLTIGTDSGNVEEMYVWTESTHEFDVSLKNQYGDILVRYNSFISFTNTSTVDISVFYDNQLIQVVSPNFEFGTNTDHSTHRIRITPSSFVDETVNITLRFNQFNQNGEDL